LILPITQQLVRIAIYSSIFGEPVLTKTFTIRKLELTDWKSYRAIRLRALQDSPDAFGATFAEQAARSDESWSARLAAAVDSGSDHPLVAEQDGAPVGLTWAKADATDSTMVELFQVWVAPEARGQGIAAQLLREAVHWARTKQARTVRLGVTQGDTPAVRLYLREGFRSVGEPEPLRPDSLLLSQTMSLAI
jgi:ribosomal protein S18 acetylase RimI-like enzyme